MSNGKSTTRELVVRIDERTENIEKNFERHLKTHQWMWILIVATPAALYTIVLLIKGV